MIWGGDTGTVDCQFVSYRFFGYSLTNIAFLFRETFVDLDYYFESKTTTPYIIDCGSNIGASILFFKTLYPNATIVAFEPAVRSFEALERNVRQNGLQNITLHRAAIGETVGTVDFYESPIVGGLTASTSKARGGEGKTTVEQVQLSAYIDRRVDLLKVDIEGSEAGLLADLVNSERLVLVEQMIIEYHHHIQPLDDRLSAFLRTLEDAGFGYDIRASLHPSERIGAFQDLWIHAYRREAFPEKVSELHHASGSLGPR